jgi:hypothetical protein
MVPRPTGRPRDPWHGPTLEWAIPLAAPRVQLRGHPDDLERVPELGRGRPGGGTAQRLERGVGLLDVGNEQPVSTAVDEADPTQIAEMPHGSPWPFVLAVCLSGMFSVLVIHEFWIAGAFLVLAGLTLLAWHA